MGSFGGHALPGSFFIVFALSWFFDTLRHYYRSKVSQRPHRRYTSTVTSVCFHGNNSSAFSFQSIPWEGIIKIVFTLIGFTLEIITGFKHGQFVHIGNGQHATMFFFFGLSGVVDVLAHYKITAVLPPGIDYVMAFLAFSVEALLFRFHLHGRTALDVLLHTLLLYAVYACCVCTLLEMSLPHNPLPRLARTYFVFLQGTWFWQIGFILYNPMIGSNVVPWHDDDHGEMMLVTMMFTWHMAAILVIMLVMAAVMSCVYTCCRKKRQQQNMQEPLLKSRDHKNHVIHDNGRQVKHEEELDSEDSV